MLEPFNARQLYGWMINYKKRLGSLALVKLINY